MNQQINLRPFMDEDMALIKEWLYAPHIAKWFHDPESWIEEIEKREGEFSWIHHCIVEWEGRSIGFCQYYAYSDGGETWQGSVEIAGSYSLDYMIGERACMGKGLGKAIINALIERIQEQPGAKRVIALPDPENGGSCGALLSSGFQFDQANQLYLYQW